MLALCIVNMNGADKVLVKWNGADNVLSYEARYNSQNLCMKSGMQTCDARSRASHYARG